MEYSHKKVLVIGMARSGRAAAAVLSQLGAIVTVNDQKTLEAFGEAGQALVDAGYLLALGQNPVDLLPGQDIVVISPGVPIDSPVVLKAQELVIPVIGEVELAFTVCDAPVVAITGTNGKTTTTALTGRMFQDAGKTTYIVGNIGIPYIEHALKATAQDIMVAEISSFQLESIQTFRPRVASVLNLTEDHLYRHYTMEGYALAKKRIFMNQGPDDYAVLNYDDPITREKVKGIRSKVFYFSRKCILEQGIFVSTDGVITITDNGKLIPVCPAAEVRMPGGHNLENALAATAMGYLAGLEPESMANTLRTFEGVEHRLEFVRIVNGITYINDSKGTNVDATIKAIEAMNSPTVLITGGSDKGSDFIPLFRAFNEHIVHLVAVGETADKILAAAQECGYLNTSKANGFTEAILQATEHTPQGGTVLLSPACASFDLFQDYEHRGRVFKEIVQSL